MTDRYVEQNKKSPLSAAILSAFFPGVGFFYIGDALKAVAYCVIFACLILLQVKVRGGQEHVVVALMMAGFYIFQIFDTYEETRKRNHKLTAQAPKTENHSSLFSGFLILGIGLVFQLAQLDLISFSDIIRLWPIVLIIMGVYYIFSFAREKKNEEKGGQNE